MTEQKQPEALRLAEVIEDYVECTEFDSEQAATELRRQHAEIEALRATLDELEKQEPVAFVNEQGFIIERDDMQISSGEKLYLAAGARPVEEVPAPALPKPKRKTSKKSCKHNDSGYADGYDDERF